MRKDGDRNSPPKHTSEEHRSSSRPVDCKRNSEWCGLLHSYIYEKFKDTPPRGKIGTGAITITTMICHLAASFKESIEHFKANTKKSTEKVGCHEEKMAKIAQEYEILATKASWIDGVEPFLIVLEKCHAEPPLIDLEKVLDCANQPLIKLDICYDEAEAKDGEPCYLARECRGIFS
ncbi:hypothetical protein Pfo_016339 [Paulownia fortunei]|nr:hypothetical protein Pfo_016339 [Paulownia fortunei]